MKSKKFLEDLRKLVIDTDGGKERHYQATLVYLQKNLDALDWLIEQAEKVERCEKALKECVERMNEGGAGTRSFVYKKLKEVIGGSE